MNCPLCKGTKVKIISKLLTKSLVNLYKTQFSYDISYLISQPVIYMDQCFDCQLKFFYPSISGDEKFYQMLQKTPGYYLRYKPEYKFASNYFDKTKNVLEIGAGIGAFSKLIKFKNYTALELNPSALKIAKGKNINIFNQSIREHAKGRGKKYDVVCFFQVLEHIKPEELYEFLVLSISVLKQGGVLIFSVPNDSSHLKIKPNEVLNLPPHHLTRWPEYTLINLGKFFNIRLLSLKRDDLLERQYQSYLLWRVNLYLGLYKGPIQEKCIFLNKVSSKLVQILGKKIRKKIINIINPVGAHITLVYKKEGMK
ncbi:MAG: class I SAM-dependent methyltransferase [Candidatus Omnitrophica bacterium]|nr:class I SAM-dependent methyltransferase [Candidatus Omnitrophota bacterium]